MLPLVIDVLAMENSLEDSKAKAHRIKQGILQLPVVIANVVEFFQQPSLHFRNGIAILHRHIDPALAFSEVPQFLNDVQPLANIYRGPLKFEVVLANCDLHDLEPPPRGLGFDVPPQFEN